MPDKIQFREGYVSVESLTECAKHKRMFCFCLVTANPIGGQSSVMGTNDYEPDHWQLNKLLKQPN